MAICPLDLKPCCDDICHGGGCMRLGGESLLVNCNGCGALIAMDGSDIDDCECEPDYDDDFDPTDTGELPEKDSDAKASD